jgi:hypothetical protein
LGLVEEEIWLEVPKLNFIFFKSSPNLYQVEVVELPEIMGAGLTD